MPAKAVDYVARAPSARLQKMFNRPKPVGGCADRPLPKPESCSEQPRIFSEIGSHGQAARVPGMSPSDSDSGAPTVRTFATTRWSIVLRAGGADSQAATRDALAALCRAYWYPLYAFVRREGKSPHDAQDLTQEFFARLLAKNWLDGVDRSRGRFRSWLLAAMKHFLINEWDKSRAQKRGGGATPIPLETGDAESRYAHEPADTATADKLFDRRWALTLLDQVLTRLRAEFSTTERRRSSTR